MIETMLSVAIGSALLVVDPRDRRSEYVEKMTATRSTAEEQFRLAAWAKKEGLKDEANGHLRAAVHLDPDFIAAHRALGRTLKDGLWESKAERQKRLADEKRFADDRKEWSKRLKELGIEHAAASRTIDEASASAIEAYANGDKKRSLAAVSAFRSATHGAASMALVRMAVASRLDDVRPAAAEALTDKNPDDFLPTLVEFVRPIDSRITVVLGVGEVWRWQDAERQFVSLPPTSLAQGLGGPATERVNLNEEAALRHADADFQRKNAVAALQQVTGAKIGEDFMAWRNVAMQITGGSIPLQRGRAKKTIRTRYEPDVVRIGSGLMPIASQEAPEAPKGAAPAPKTSAPAPTPVFVGPVGVLWQGRLFTNLTTGRVRVGSSCFAAGTPVATKRGLVPIDEVCVGELVLSRNAATGETGYKPVLARTLLPAREMRAIELGGDSILSTMAHPFWSPTLGWAKAKDIAHGTPVALESGVVAVGRNAPGESAQAYNLVVAEWSTYFVGRSRILVHDNSPIRDSVPDKR